MLKRIAAIALALVLTGCAAKVGGRANYRELTVAAKWAQAQYWLAERTNGHSYEVPYAMFTWKFDDKPIRLVDENTGAIALGLGYFDPSKQEIFIALPFVPGHVIEHEACHAILFSLGDDGWSDYCHHPDRPWFMTR
jgi:hypothetical protein